MGKKRVKRFIDPAKQQIEHYHLVHRSTRDVKQGVAGESQFVLLPSRKGNASGRAQEGDLGGETQAWTAEDDESLASGGVRDHVNELGLPNDGYDYSRHLKSMGGGRFISANGQVSELALPEDPEDLAKAMEGELPNPVVDAVTLSHEVMDDDMKAALFDEAEEGGFEEITDDFVLQAAEEPAVDSGDDEGGKGGFDFEEHMARLIEASERQMGWRAAQGWDEGELEELREGGRRYLSESDDESEDSGVGSHRRPAVGEGHEERNRVETEFEELLAEYSDDEIGELQDPLEDETTRGHVEVDGEDPYLDQVLDSFINSRLDDDDASSSDEKQVRPHSKTSGSQRPEAAGIGRGSGLFAQLPVKVESEVGSGPAAGTESLAVEGDEEQNVEEPTAPADHHPDEEMDKFITEHDYLGDKAEPCRWDCETILTTCSNLDNHPRLIAEPSKRRRKPSVTAPDMYGDEPEGAVAMLQLSKKSGLPIGVLPAREKLGKTAIAGDNAGVRRDKEESKEDKAARKAAVKEERRQRREEKRGVKDAFRSIYKSAAARAANGEMATSRSVFVYRA